MYVAISHVSKFLNSNVSVTNRDVVPKQKYDRFLSVGDHIHELLLLSMPGQPQDLLLEEVLKTLREVSVSKDSWTFTL